MLVQRWRQLYNRVRPHSALGYRPPAPEAIEPLPPGFPELLDIGEQRLTQKMVQTLGGRSRPRELVASPPLLFARFQRDDSPEVNRLLVSID